MKYLVMECHPAYAVVLTEDGRFLKAANMHYEVGQTVTEIIQLHLPETVPAEKKNRSWLKPVASLAACMAIAVTSLFYVNLTPYASVYMTINPEVRIDVNRKDTVLQVEGINEDGAQLIEGYSHKGKDLDLVMDELVDLAIDQGYLHEGGTVTLSLDADETWSASHGEHLNTHLNEHLAEKITVTIDVEQKTPAAPETQPREEIKPIVIPVAPESYGDSDYGEKKDDDRDEDDWEKDGVSDYGKKDDGDSGYEKKPSSPKDTDDGNTDYDASEEKETDYAKPSKTDTSAKKEADGDEDDEKESDYAKPSNTASTVKKEAETDYEAAEEGVTAYETSSNTTTSVKKEPESDYESSSETESAKKQEEEKQSDYEEDEEEAESDYEKD